MVISEPAEISARYFSARSTTGTLNTDNNNDDVPWWYPSEFVVDLLSSLPLDLLALGLGVTSLKFLRLNRLCRSFWRLPELMDTCDHFVHQKLNVWSGFYSLFLKVWVLFWLANHLCACGWIFIHRYLERNVEFTWATVDGVSTWDPGKGEHNIFHDRTLAYSRAFYFVIVVISTCGYGDIRPYTNIETVFAQGVTLVGALGLATMVGTFLFYFQYVDECGTFNVRQKFRRLMTFGRKHKWSKHTVQQLKNQCGLIWDETAFLSESKILQLLSVPLQMEVVQMTRASLFDSVLFQRLKGCGGRVEYFATCFRLEIFVRGQGIYRLGEDSVGLFVVSKGLVSIKDHRNLIMETVVGKGEHFGKWNSERYRVNSAVAVDDCHLYRCCVEDVFQALERMSELNGVNFMKDIEV